MRRHWPAASVLAAALTLTLTSPAAAATDLLPVVSLEPTYVCWESIPRPAPERVVAAAPQECKIGLGLSGPPSGKVVVRYKTAQGSATPQLDYVDVREGAVTIPPGATAGQIVVWILPDQVREPDEVFAVQLLHASGATIGRPLGVVTIRDATVQPGG
jgi:Calx-beta domain